MLNVREEVFIWKITKQKRLSLPTKKKVCICTGDLLLLDVFEADKLPNCKKKFKLSKNAHS